MASAPSQSDRTGRWPSGQGGRRQWVRMGVAAVSWVLSVAAMQIVVGVEIGGATRRLEQRIELQLKSRGATAPAVMQPERPHEEPIEPWELVGV